MGSKRVGVVAAALMTLLSGCQVATDPYGRTVVSSPTMGQVLGLSSRPGVQPRSAFVTPAAATDIAQDQRTVGGHAVQVLKGQRGYQIVVDSRVIAEDNQDDHVVIRDVYRGGGRTYILIEEQSGGIACPSLYQAIDLTGAAPLISPQFGNCSDIPKVGVIDGRLRVSVPKFRAAPATTYTFQDGRLTR